MIEREEKKGLDGTWGVSSAGLRGAIYTGYVVLSVLVIYPLLLLGVVPMYIWMYLTDYFDDRQPIDLTPKEDEDV